VIRVVDCDGSGRLWDRNPGNFRGLGALKVGDMQRGDVCLVLGFDGAYVHVFVSRLERSGWLHTFGMRDAT